MDWKTFKEQKASGYPVEYQESIMKDLEDTKDYLNKHNERKQK